MRKIYVWNDCEGSKKAIELLNEKSFDFQKINESDLLDMSNLSPNGLVGLINPLSAKLKELGVEDKYKSFSKLELINLIMNNPGIISYPIALQYNPNKKPKRLIIGFNSEEWLNKLYDDPNVSIYYNNINASYQFEKCCFFDKLKDGKEAEFDINADSIVLNESDEEKIKSFLSNDDEFDKEF